MAGICRPSAAEKAPHFHQRTFGRSANAPVMLGGSREEPRSEPGELGSRGAVSGDCGARVPLTRSRTAPRQHDVIAVGTRGVGQRRPIRCGDQPVKIARVGRALDDGLDDMSCVRSCAKPSREDELADHPNRRVEQGDTTPIAGLARHSDEPRAHGLGELQPVQPFRQTRQETLGTSPISSRRRQAHAAGGGRAPAAAHQREASAGPLRDPSPARAVHDVAIRSESASCARGEPQPTPEGRRPSSTAQ